MGETLTLPPPPRPSSRNVDRKPSPFERLSGCVAPYPRESGIGFPLTVCHTHTALASKEERSFPRPPDRI